MVGDKAGRVRVVSQKSGSDVVVPVYVEEVEVFVRSVQVRMTSLRILSQCVVQEGQAEVRDATQPVGAVLAQYGKGENQGSDRYGGRREEHGSCLC